jgi:hypothetical protein
VLEAADRPRDLPNAHESRTIEGWRVRVDTRLLEGQHKPLGDEALVLLEDRLRDIVRRLDDARLADLRTITIQLDCTHGRLGSMQYHPSAAWLRENGYSEQLARCVHIPLADQFVSPGHQQVQPWSVLHELAHAYHDQFLEFDNPKIRSAFRVYATSGRGDKVLHIDGRTTEHYALTNHKEFFAEMTEAYIGSNDFFPFNRGELRSEFPEIHVLLAEIWGPMPRRPR